MDDWIEQQLSLVGRLIAARLERNVTVEVRVNHSGRAGKGYVNDNRRWYVTIPPGQITEE